MFQTLIDALLLTIPGEPRSKRRRVRIRKLDPQISAEVEILQDRTMLSATWSGAGDGTSWNNPANWVGSTLPTINDDVIINISAASKVVISGAAASAKTVTCTGALDLNAVLNVTGNVDIAGGIKLSAGTIQGGNVLSGTKLTFTSAGAALVGVTVQGEMDFTSGNSSVTVVNGLTLNGTMTLGTDARVYFNNSGNQTLTGTGTVVFTNAANALVASTTGMTLTIDTGITIRGGSNSGYGATIGYSGAWGGGNNTSIVNKGTINADTAGTAVRLSPAGNGTITNEGVINVSTGDLVLGGTFTRAGLGTLNHNGGNLYLQGTLNNTGNTLTLDGAAQSWILQGGTVNGGTVTTTNGAKLAYTSNGGTLVGVTVNGNMDFTSGNSSITVVNGLTLNGTMTLGTDARVYFNNSGNQTLTGTGTVVFTNAANALVASTTGMTLTIDTGITIRGGSNSGYGATIGYSGVWGGGNNTSIVNKGTINADTAGTAIRINPAGNGTITNEGVINVSTGDLVLGGTFTRAALGTLNRNGGNLYLQGTLNNTGNTLTLDGAAQSWILQGGSINGGTVTTTNGAKLAYTSSGGTLVGVTVNGNIDLSTSGTLFGVSGGLTLNGTMTLGSDSRVYFTGSQTLGGTGTVVFNNGANALIANTTGMTLTIDTGITIRGGSSNSSYGATIGYSPAWGGGNNTLIVNKGTINADTAGTAIRLLPAGNGTITNEGVINVSTGDLVLGGTFTRAALGTLNRNGGNLYLQGTLNNTGNTLTLDGAAQSWILQGGSINGGTVTTTNGAKLAYTSSGGTLVGVTVNGNIDLSTSGTLFGVSGGLTLNGTMTLGSDSRVYFTGSQTLGGTGTVVFNNGANALIANTTGMTLTIDTGITIRGGSSNSSYGATIGYSPAWGGGNNTSIVNKGTINADTAGTAIRLLPAGNGTITNEGVINVSTGDLVLGGTFTRAALGTLNRNGGNLYLQGTLNNTGNTLTLDGAAQSWILQGGSINGGTVTTTNGAKLAYTSSGGTLVGVTVNGNIDLSTSGTLFGVSGGLILNGTMTLGSDSRVYFTGSQTLGGTGTVVFNNAANALIANTTGMTLTIDTGITIRGGSNSGYGATIGYSPAWGGGNNTSIVNKGTINADTAGTAIRINPAGNGTITNEGVINVSTGDLALGGTFTRAALGTLNRNGGNLYLQGTLNNTGNTLTLDGAAQSWILQGGSINGGTVTTTNGAKLAYTSSGGTLVGVTINGNIDLSTSVTLFGISGGLTLNGTMTLGSDSRVYFTGSQTLGGTGTVVFNNAANALIANTTSMTLTIDTGITIRGGSGSIYGATIGYSPAWGGGNNTSIINKGTINADVSGTGIRLNPAGNGTITNEGTFSSRNGGILYANGPLTQTTTSLIREAPSGAMQFTGNFTSPVTALAQFSPDGTVILAGTGTAVSPQLIEAMSQDQGTATSAFNDNFVFGTLTLANNTYVKLVDTVDNASGVTAEAIYANSVIVNTGTTLNLNGFHLYTRALQLSGTVVNGTITQIPDSGALEIGTPTPGAISPAGQLDEWSFYGVSGRSVTVSVNPGTSGTPAPISPQLQWAKVELVNSANTVIATANGTVSGSIVTLNNIVLPATDIYRIRISAANGHVASTGNYIVTAWDSTPNLRTLNLNATAAGSLSSPFGQDQWTFTASVDTQVRFDLLNTSTSGITFTLSGPGGYTGFTDIFADSTLLNLPATGQYTLMAHSLTGALGSYAFNMLQTTVTDLALGGTYNGTFAGSGNARLFRINVPSNQVLSLQLNDGASTDWIELYSQFSTQPTRETYDYRFGVPGNNQSLVIPSAMAGDWYVLVYADNSTLGNSFSLTATGSVAKIFSAVPAHAGNSRPITMTLTGAGFTQGTAVSLVAADGVTTYQPDLLNIDLFTQMTVTFAAGLPAGNYSLRVSRDGNSDTLPAALTVTPGGQAQLETNLILPNALGRHAIATLYVEYANTGDVAMPAPLLSLQSSDDNNSDRPVLTLDQSRLVEGFWSNGLPPGTSNSILILGGGQQPGILNPGERIRVPVYYLGLQQPWDFSDSQIELEIRYWTEDDALIRPILTWSASSSRTESNDNGYATPIDWASRQEELRPPTLSTEQWAAIYGNLTSELVTTNDYVKMLNENARYLAQLGENVRDVDDLWNFEVQQAYGFTAVPTLDSVVDASMPSPGVSLEFSRSYSNSLYSRYQMGPFGRGWSAPWQTTLVSLDNGNLIRIVGQDGSARAYSRDTRNGSYFSGAGDSSTLVALGGGVFEIRAISGTITRFRADGKIDYVADPNNNRVTASYNASGRLVTLTHTSGATLTIAYNAQGLITSVTDSGGRATTYGYDLANAYLTSVTTSDGKVTTYAYQSSGPAQTKHALLSIQRGGTTQFFTYDSRGRLDTSYLSGNAQFVDYEYSATGLVTVDDDVSTPGLISLFFDYNGQLAKTVDPLGNLSSNVFDLNLRLIKTVGPTGEGQSYTWCNCGSMTSVVNELGQKTSFTYDYINGSSFKRMTSFTDAKGNTTRYNYDAKGNLLETIYPDGSIERLNTYTAAGLPGVSVNRRGQPLSYTYNVLGQVTKQTFADNSFITFAYDARGNLTTVTDGAEVTTYTYNLGVDGDRLKRITYPNGRYLDYTYDSFGRRTEMVDQDGYATKYEYDSAGRLYRLRDASDALLVTYTYDGAGRLSRIDKGNGTFTTYVYDAAGQILSLKNWQNATTLNSKFDYTYDNRGRRISMTTLDGSWVYNYDSTGQLTRAIFTSLNTSVIPNQDLQYFYDAVGNRLKTVLNGVTAFYEVDRLNQYKQVDGVGYAYDADGNVASDGVFTYLYDQQSRLVQVNGPSGTTQYEYDVFGNRVAQTVNGSREELLIDPTGLASVAGIFGPSGVGTHYAYGLGLVSQASPSGYVAFFNFDSLGSTSEITDVNGDLLSQFTYRPFGELLAQSVGGRSPFEFLGQWGGMSSTLFGGVQTGERMLLTKFGRYAQLDPIRINGGDSNQYKYANNTPTNAIDIDGRRWFLPTNIKNYDKYQKYTGAIDKGNGAAEVAGANSCVERAIALGGVGLSSGLGVLGAGIGATIGWNVGIRRLKPLEGIRIGATVGETILSGVGGIVGEWVGEKLGKVFCDKPPQSPPGNGGGGGGSGGSGGGGVAGSVDPNEKRAEAGYGPQGFVAAGSTIPYRIEFENYATASAPAQNVTISDFLSSNFDWSTFRLTNVGFGDTVITIPPNSQHFQTTRSMTYNGKVFDVLIELGLRVATGEVFAIFQSLDPNSELPPDVLTGFLPPEDGTGRGIGFFGYTIQPKANLASGTEIRNVAVISFDSQLAIATDQVSPLDASQGIDPDKQARITIDAVAPTATMESLPASTTSGDFGISWTGQDNIGGSGIKAFNIYVSRDNGAWLPVLLGTTSTSVNLTGFQNGTYRFAAIGIDNVGLIEQGSLTAEATIQVVSPNSAPTDITLTATSIDENQAAGAIVGTFGSIDPDAGNTFTYSLVDGIGASDNASFTVDSNGRLTTGSAFNFEAKSSYAIRVQTADQGGLKFEKAFVISVANVNEAPVNMLLTSITIAENQAVGATVGTLTTTDPDNGDTFGYSLIAGTGSGDNSLFRIVGNVLQTNAVLNFEAQASYSIRVRTADAGGLGFEKVFTVSATNVNEVPTDISLSASTVAENQAVGTVVGNFSSTDPDSGETFGYSLVSGAGSADNGSFQIVGNVLQTNAVLNFEAKSAYSIRVRTTDGGGLSFEKTFTITVTNVNEVPSDFTLSASPVAENQPVGTVVGTLSTTDPDAGDSFGYALVAGTGSTDNLLFRIVGNVIQTNALLNFETRVTYSIRVRSTDTAGLQFEKPLTITVTDVNESPVDISISANTVLEGQPLGTVVGNFTTSDPDAGSSFTYAFTSGAGSTDNGIFRIVGSTLQTNAVLDFEGQSSYSVRVLVTDAGGLSFEKAFVIAVTNVNEAPSNLTLSNSVLQENQPVGSVVGLFSTVDPDTGDSFSYTLVPGNGSEDNSLFRIVGNALQTNAILDLNTKSTYSIRVRTMDAGGLLFEKVFVVSTTNVNEAPTDLVLSSNTIAENQPVGTVIGNLTTIDPDANDTFSYTLVPGTGSGDNQLFQIVGDRLQSKTVLDFESRSTYSIRVRTTDAGGLQLEKVLSIAVSNVNEAPTNLGLSNSSVLENQPIGTSVGTLTTTDPDAGDGFTYSLTSGLGSTDNNRFQIVGNTLRTNSVLNFEAQASYAVRIQSQDAAGLVIQKEFIVTATDVNEVPVDVILSGSSVAENQPAGTVIGNLTTFDPDLGETFTYALVDGTGGTDNASFRLVGNTLQTSGVLNFESKASHAIRVRTTDAAGLTFEKAFTISVTNVNESPYNIVLSANSIPEDAVVGTEIGKLTSSDPDLAETFTYTLVGGTGSTDNVLFRLQGDILQTNASLNLALQASYSIRVRTTDAGGLTFEKVFIVSGSHVNDAPTDLSLSAQTLAENQPIGTAIGVFETVDPDLGDTFSYVLVSGSGSADNTLFRIVGNELQSNATLNFESRSTYSIRVRSTDSGGLQIEKLFAISIQDINESPTDLNLSVASVGENLPIGTTVGTWLGIDPDLSQVLSYSLVPGTGSRDNGLFRVVGDTLQTNAVLDFETQPTLTVRARVTDAAGLTFEKAFTITVTQVGAAPTDLMLSASSIEEAQPIGTTVGTFTTADPDINDTFQYTLVAGAGSQDNSLFQIVDHRLLTATVFDFELQSSYSIRVRTTDATGQSFEKTFTVSVTNVNEGPTNLKLSAETLLENSLPTTLVGTFSSSDPDLVESVTYTLVSGAGSADNSRFQITGFLLRTDALLDFESQSTYSIRVRATDAGGLTVENVFTISLSDVNEVPISVSLSATTIPENQVAGTTIGDFSSTDPDTGDTFVYSLVPGVGSTDNGRFEVVGNSLRTLSALDFEAQASYSIRVRSADRHGLSLEQVFTISVSDANEVPTSLALSASTIAENQPVGTSIGNFTSSDPDAGDAFTYSLVSGVGSLDNGQFEIVGNSLRTLSALNFEAQPGYSIRVRTTDRQGLSLERVFAITVSDVNEAPTLLELSALTIAENQAAGTSVGNFTSSDADAGDVFVYSLVSGLGSSDNGQFEIVGNTLRTRFVFDFEGQATYSIRVRSTDSNGLVYEQPFVISVANRNEPPSGLELSANSLGENRPVGTPVGILTAIDPESSGGFTYTLASGVGSEDNAQFVIVNDQLRIASSFDFEQKNSYSIRVSVADSAGLTFERQFNIAISNVDEVPTISPINDQRILEDATTSLLTFVVADPESAANELTVTATSSNKALIPDSNVILSGGDADRNLFIFPVEHASGTSTITLSVSDGTNSTTTTFIVTVDAVNDGPTMSVIAAQNTLEDTPTTPISFTVADIDTPLDALVLQTTSSNPALIPDANIVISGSGRDRTLVVTPAENQSGVATIQVTVRDGESTFTRTFDVTVQAVDDAPELHITTVPLTYKVSSRSVVAIDPAATLTDPDSANLNLGGATLRVTGAINKETISVLKQGGISRRGKNILDGKTVIGTVSGGKKGLPMIVALNSSATQSSTQALLRSIGFKSTNKLAMSRTIYFQITDIAGTETSTVSRQIFVEP